MPVNLPSSPTINQIVVSGLSTYQWNGSVWNVIEHTNKSTQGTQGIQGLSGQNTIEYNGIFNLPQNNIIGSNSSVNFSAGSYLVNQNYSDNIFTLGNTSIKGSGVITTTTTSTYVSIKNYSGTPVWTTVPSNPYTPSTNQINSVLYANGKYLVGGNGGASNYLISSTDTVTWSTSDINYNVNSLAYGNGIYIAVGTNNYRVSTDAITWSSKPNLSNTINVVIYENNLYIMGGQSGYLVTSTDATTWTSQTSGFGTTSIRTLAYGNGIYLAGGTNGYLTTSTDAVTWTTRTSGIGGTLLSSIYANGVYLMGSSTGYLIRSTDAVTWTPYYIAGGNSIYSLTYSGNAYVAAYPNYIYSSIDGITWSRSYTPSSNRNFFTSTYNPIDKIFLVGGNGAYKTINPLGAETNNSYAWIESLT